MVFESLKTPSSQQWPIHGKQRKRSLSYDPQSWLEALKMFWYPTAYVLKKKRCQIHTEDENLCKYAGSKIFIPKKQEQWNHTYISMDPYMTVARMSDLSLEPHIAWVQSVRWPVCQLKYSSYRSTESLAAFSTDSYLSIIDKEWGKWLFECLGCAFNCNWCLWL